MTITVTLGGVEYTGPMLTLDDIAALAKEPLERVPVAAIRLWCEHPETTPRPPSPLRLTWIEAIAGGQRILGLSGLKWGEAAPGPE